MQKKEKKLTLSPDTRFDTRFVVAQSAYGEAQLYPMSLPESQRVSMLSFMSIGPKLWVLQRYIHTHTETDSPSFIT